MKWEQIGWNAVTFSLCATFLFSIWGFWGMLRQVLDVWRARSGKSIAVPWLLVAAGGWGSNFVYGVFHVEPAMFFLGLCRTPLALILLWLLWKYKGFQSPEWGLAGIVLALLCWMIFFSSNQHAWYFAFSVAGIPFAWMQPREMLKNKSRGVTAIQNLLATFVSCSFWAIYGGIQNDNVVVSVSLGYAATYGCIMFLWLWYYAIELITTEVEHRI